MAKKYTFENVKQYFSDNGCVLLSAEYTSYDIPLDYMCACGTVSKIRFRTFKNGSRCENCRRRKISDKKKFTFQEVLEMFRNRDCELLSDKYVGNSTKMPYKCSCGNISEITLQSFRAGSKCEKCAMEGRKEKLSFNFEQVKEMFLEQNCVLIEEDYTNSKARMKYLCKCGRESFTSLDNFRSGKRCFKCAVEGRSGENGSNYNPNITDEERQRKRLYEDYYTWRKLVFERDDYSCSVCNQKGGKINAHHLDGYNWCKEKRTDVSNGVTLCKTCHNEFHDMHGRGFNTSEQFDEWILNKRNQDAN